MRGEIHQLLIGTSTLLTPIPSTCSTEVLDGFHYFHTGEFIKFSICSTKARTLPSGAAFVTSNPKSGDSTIVILLNFDVILRQKCVPTSVPKICFGRLSSGIHLNIQKGWKLVNVRVCQEIMVFPN